MIRLVHNNKLSRSDLDRPLSGNLVKDDGLEAAILISLFTERKADPADDPQQGKDLRGWWGDAFPEVTDDLIGSRFWLIQRAKTTQETLNLFQRYAEEALQWLLDDGAAKTLTITVERIKPQLAGVRVVIERPEPGTGTYDEIWEVRSNAL